MRKIANKFTSAVLVLALCVSALCGALIPANAAAAGNTYTIVGDAVAASTKTVTMEVTLTSATGLTSGSFDLMFGSDVIDDVNFDADGNYIDPTNETVEQFRARDTDGNFMIAAVNYYKTEEYQSPIYNDAGEITGYETKTRTVIDKDKSYTENDGNKGVLLPNAYDGTVGLYDTKIEITGGTKADGTAFDIADFTNGDYATFAKDENNTTNAVEGSQTIGSTDYKYVYNMTDGYKATHYNSNGVTYHDITETVNGVATTKTVIEANQNLLDKYYREYTTVDVATANLGYSISTVSEDSIGSTHAYAQYAQGFKDITFNSDAAYTSITFTVTLDFSGVCDRISANNGADADKLIGTTTVDGNTVKYRNSDGHWATENYIQYGKKYQLNFVSDDATLSTYSAAPLTTDYFHVHSGRITEEVGLADPVNKAAIDALLAENPEAQEGVDYFELYDAVCDCGQTTPMIAAPDLPYKVTDESGTDGTKGAFGFNNYRNISGVSLNYNNDGTVALNVHYPSSMDGEQLLVTDENGIVLDCSDTLEVADDRTSVFTATASNFAGYKADSKVSRYTGALMSSSQMVTIDNLSAREVDQTLYIARYTPSSSTETQLMGITHAISIANYCSEVIKGDNVYYLKDDNYSETKAEQDKAVAAAFINYAVASKNALAIKTSDYVAPPSMTDTWEGRSELALKYDKNGNADADPADSANWVLGYRTWGMADAEMSGSGTEKDPYIIETAEQLRYIVAFAGDKSKGQYYKVADNIKAFYISNGVTEETSYEDAIATLKAKTNGYWDCQQPFQGHFDGNGVTITGITTTTNHAYSGLFPQVKGDVTIKNVNITNSCMVCYAHTGALVGTATHNSDASNTLGSLTIENCSVTDCYMESTGIASWGTVQTRSGVAAIVGQANLYYGAASHNGLTHIKNCYVNLDEDNFNSACESTDNTDILAKGLHGGLTLYNGSNKYKAENCVVVGIKPYTVWDSTNTLYRVNHNNTASYFSNIYTDQSISEGYANATLQNYTNKMFKLTADEMTGEAAATNMSGLNWDTVWYTTESYPQIYTPYNVPDVERTIYWDNTVATSFAGGTGEKDDPYIIDTASQLAYLVSCKDTTLTQGKYFKIADGIKNIVLQYENNAAGIMALKDAAECKSHFEKGGFIEWVEKGWEQSAFCGHFDGNGATVYGLYSVSANNAGLFSSVDAGATIKNIALKNSYLTSTSGNHQVGGIAAVSNSTGGGLATNGAIWIDGCTVANSYMHNAAPSTGLRSGVIFGAASDVVYIDNCLVYGNDATDNDGVEMPIISTVGNTIYASTAICPAGLTVITHNDNGNIYIRNMVRNTITLGTAPYNITAFGYRKNDSPCFENVYTDAATGTIVFANTDTKGNYYTTTYNTSQIKHIEIDDIYGSGAVVEMPNLDWYDAMTNPDGVWYFGYNTALPSLSKIENTMLPELQSSYDAVIFEKEKEDTIGAGTEWNEDQTKMEFGVYATALSLKANPYMSFAFAFHGDYRTNRDKIQVRFTYTVNGTEYVYGDDAEEQAAIAIPKYVEGEEIRNVNGWTNTKSAVRYHTFKASFIPVEAMVNGIRIEANYDNNGWVDLGTFSVDGIGGEFVAANTATPCDYYATRVEAAKAFKFYVQQVNARYGTIQ